MSQIKSRRRVRDLAEVYTNEREVNSMLDLIPFTNDDDIITYKYLEPACGNGNFLIEILRRKINRLNTKYANKSVSEFEFHHAKALTTIYGIDICKDNVEEAIERLYREVKSNIDLHKGSFLYSDGFFSFVRYILTANIVVGDSIGHPNEIELIEFVARGRAFERRIFNFADLVEKKPLPIKILPAENFLRIGQEYHVATGCDDESAQASLKLR